MAARNVKAEAFEGMDKLSSATLKRNPKNMDLNKNDLLRLLGYLEGELQARDITIAALKAEKAKQLFNQAKYGRFGLGDPFLALQRDSDSQRDNTFDEAAVKAMYDNQLTQLENLIATQRKAQQRMRAQLAAVEKRYHKVLADLEEEKRKHAQDTEQGDNVTYLLEKERERLKQELEFEKAQVKKLEKELKKASSSSSALSPKSEESSDEISPAKHKQMAILLIKERNKLIDKLMQLQQRNTQIEQTLKAEQSKTKNMAEGLSCESQKALQMEAEMEKHLADCDTERTQLTGRLSKEEAKNKQLQQDIEHLKQQLEHFEHSSPQAIEIKSIQRQSVVDSRVMTTSATAAAAALGKSYKNTPPSTPPEARRVGGIIRESPERDLTSMHKGINSDSSSRVVKNLSFGGSKSPDRTVLPERPVPAEKPPDLGARMAAMTGGSSQTGSPTMFTTPSGTRITVAVGGGGGQAATRGKPLAGRIGPPPIPPNKPQVVLPARSPLPLSSSSSSPTPPLPKPRHSTLLNNSSSSSTQITVANDKITISSGGSRPVSVNANQANMFQTSTSASASSTSSMAPPPPTRKPPPPQTTQFDVATTRADDPLPSSSSSSTSSTSSNNALDFFGPEMADLQQLLVSMVTGTSESDTSSVEDLSDSSSSSLPSYPHSSCAPVRPLSLPLLTPPDASSYPLHTYAACGDLASLKQCLSSNKQADVNQPMQDGSTPVHAAAEHGHAECLSYLLENGGNTNALREDNFSPVHSAAGEGHHSCLQMLLESGGFVNQSDQSGWTPLHWAAYNGHADCCRVLMQHRARLDAVTSTSWTPLHGCVHMGHADCLSVLLTTSTATGTQEQKETSAASLNNVVKMADKDGWTVGHLAAIKEEKECLATLLQHCELDLRQKDKLNRTVNDVASLQCREYLQGIVDKNEHHCTVSIELPDSSHLHVARLTLTPEQSWPEVEEQLSVVFLQHVSQIVTGLKTRRTNKADAESPESPTPYSLGLTMNSVKHYTIGLHSWSPGTPSESSPFHIMTENEVNNIGINLFDLEDGCQDSLAYETLIPVPTLQNYLRLVEQYKNVIFYGPSGTGKSLLARKLAQCVQAREAQHGNIAEIHFVTLSDGLTAGDFLAMLVEKGCLIPASGGGSRGADGQSPVVVLDDLGKIDVAEVLKDILPAIEDRDQPGHVLTAGSNMSYRLHPNCYILGTMDRSRFTGLDLSVQQKFRWVHFRNDQEPIRTLLHRHLYRRLVHKYKGMMVPHEDMMFRCVEWIVCVWLRLNEGLGKLGLHDVVFGPAHFLPCPIDANKPKGILRWLSLLWNHKIAPTVSAAVIRGAGTSVGGAKTAAGQHKVANTALYVLMQRAVVSCCPLSGQEKERYLSSFQGSNELDIKMKTPEKKPATLSVNKTRTPAKRLHKGGTAFPWSSGREQNNSPPTKDNAPVDNGVHHHHQNGEVARTPVEGQPASGHAALPSSSAKASPTPAVRHSLTKLPAQVVPRPSPPKMNLGPPVPVQAPPPPYPAGAGAYNGEGETVVSPGGSILSPNAHMLFGNSIFAVSGIPSPSGISPQSSEVPASAAVGAASPSGGGGGVASGPGRGASPAPARVAKGSTPPRIPPPVTQRSSSLSHSSPQLHPQRPQSAGGVKRPTSLSGDPRRALSPGPEMYRTAPHEMMARRAFSPGPDILTGDRGKTRTANIQPRAFSMGSGRASVKPK